MMKTALIYPDRLDSDALWLLQKERLLQMESLLEKKNWKFDRYNRRELPETLDNYDLVVAAGGDGTQLDAAMRMLDTPLCAIRLFPEKSIGFHCSADFDQFETLISRIEEGSAVLADVPRLQAVVDETYISVPILNDILVAHACPARASRYEISFENAVEAHCSSGIWIATQPGSHGASKSAGAPVLESAQSEKAVFCVRECAMSSAKIHTGIVIPGQTPFGIRIQSAALNLYFDGGLSVFSISKDQMLTICAHPNPLKKWLL